MDSEEFWLKVYDDKVSTRHLGWSTRFLETFLYPMMTKKIFEKTQLGRLGYQISIMKPDFIKLNIKTNKGEK